MDHKQVQDWLDRYLHAWKTYDEVEIHALFSEDAIYSYGPYRDTLQGRAAIVADWLDGRDTPNTYAASYHPVVVEGNTAIANGRSRYFAPDGKTLRTEFDNIFLMRFDDAGRCIEFREWFMERPDDH